MLFLLFSLFTFDAQASQAACPNLAGVYRFDKEWNGSLTVTQKGCEEITLKFNKAKNAANAKSTISRTFRPNSHAYAEWFSSTALAQPFTARFNRALFENNSFVRRMFIGSQKECPSGHNFTNLQRCKLFEMRLGYNEQINSFVWTQIGFTREPNGWYSQDEFLLIKEK